MKKTYAFILSAAMLAGVGLSSCSSDNTTGVDTGTTASEGAGSLNGGDGGTSPAGQNVSPLDTANNSDALNNGGTINGNTNNTGNNGNTNNNGNTGNTGNNQNDNNAARTTTPRTDNGY